MQYPHTNYDALMAVHRARLEAARSSAAAAGLGNRPRRRAHTLSRLSRRRTAIRPDHSPDTLFFA
jgi:hypothetical protein